MPKKTVSIVLGASFTRFADRFEGAVAAYLEKPKDHLILISGSDWINDDRNRYYAKAMQVRYKIPSDDVKAEDKSSTTRQNAVSSKHHLDKIGADIRELNVFGDSTQMARVKRYFRKEFGPTVNFYAVQRGLSTIKDLPREALSSPISLLPSNLDEILSERLDNLRRRFSATLDERL